VFVIAKMESAENLGSKIQKLNPTEKWENVPDSPPHPVKIDVN